MSSLPSPLPGSTSASYSNPLAPLTNQGYSVQSFTYPIDIATDPGEQHFMVFYINETSNTQFKTTSGVTSGPLTASGSTTPTTPATPTVNTGGVNATQNISRVSTAIILYIPMNVQSDYGVNWDTVELGPLYNGTRESASGGELKAALQELGAAGIKSGLDIAAGFTSVGGINTPLYDIASLQTRAAVNPHAEVLFRNVGFRKFQFDYKFTPRSEQEATNVNNIIQAFSFYMAPEIKNAGSTLGKYFIYPGEFDIEFWSNGAQNTFIKKISTCALTNLSVNYTGAGNGWSAFRGNKAQNTVTNGVPVETHLSLQFTELEIMTKTRILQGF